MSGRQRYIRLSDLQVSTLKKMIANDSLEEKLTHEERKEKRSIGNLLHRLENRPSEDERMSKREKIAAMAMQGLLAHNPKCPAVISLEAREHADTLIALLEKSRLIEPERKSVALVF